MNSDPDTFLPLSAPVFHILLSLADRERHGYAIIKEIERRTSESIVLSTGTLYAALKRLSADGLIEGAKGRADPELDDKRRLYYQLTSAGKLVVRAETERLAALVSMARHKQLSPWFSGGSIR